MLDEELPPISSPGLERGKSAIGVQNNAGLVIERVALELRREPSLVQQAPAGDELQLPVGSLALAHAVCGIDVDVLPAQVLSMIRAQSADLAVLEPIPGEEKSFEQADPANIPIAPANVPNFLPRAFAALFRPKKQDKPSSPSAAAVGVASTSTSSTCSCCSSSSSSSSSSASEEPECFICGGVEGEMVEAPVPEEKAPEAAASSSALPTPGQVFNKANKPPQAQPAPAINISPAKPAMIRLEILKMSCSHSICRICFDRQLTTGWTGARASFNYLNCGLCSKQFSGIPYVQQALAPHLELQQKVNVLALQKFNEEGAVLLKEMVDKGKLKQNHSNLERQEVALATMAIYKCVDCRNVFCGGRVSCAEEMDQDPSNMRCQACVWVRLARETDHRCMIHGFKFAIFKCDSCCALATWDCGWNHFCERCHGEACSTKNYPCPGPDKCPLGMPHPANLPANFGQSSDNNFIIPFVIGCMACVGYTAENPGCSRPSPAEMHWETKSDQKAEEDNKKKLENEQALNRAKAEKDREQQQRAQRAQSAALPGQRQVAGQKWWKKLLSR